MHRALVSAVGAAVLASSVACTAESSSPAPIGKGDDFFGLDATPGTPVGDNGGDGSVDDVFLPLDGGAYGTLPDGYAPLALCSQCGCEGGTYCFGGSAATTFSGVCDQTASTTLAVGCNALPSDCADASDCVCLLSSIVPQTSCYPACAGTVTTGFSVYCAP
ncbi:MAG TPA: hypothetical protein VGM06_00470 [Polyangiaceae bacterium]|jgi:hypothetical protein